MDFWKTEKKQRQNIVRIESIKVDLAWNLHCFRFLIKSFSSSSLPMAPKWLKLLISLSFVPGYVCLHSENSTQKWAVWSFDIWRHVLTYYVVEFQPITPFPELHRRRPSRHSSESYGKTQTVNRQHGVQTALKLYCTWVYKKEHILLVLPTSEPLKSL